MVSLHPLHLLLSRVCQREIVLFPLEKSMFEYLLAWQHNRSFVIVSEYRPSLQNELVQDLIIQAPLIPEYVAETLPPLVNLTAVQGNPQLDPVGYNSPAVHKSMAYSARMEVVDFDFAVDSFDSRQSHSDLPIQIQHATIDPPVY